MCGIPIHEFRKIYYHRNKVQKEKYYLKAEHFLLIVGCQKHVTFLVIYCFRITLIMKVDYSNFLLLV